MKTILRLILVATALLSWFPAVQAASDASASNASNASNVGANSAARFVVVTHIDLLPDTPTTPVAVETGIQLLKNYVIDSAQANGAISARLITWAPTNNHFQVIEVWKSRAAFEAHIGTPQVIAFRNNLQPLIGSPYEQRLYDSTSVPGGRTRGDAATSPF